MLGRRPLWHGVLLAAAGALIALSLLAFPQTRIGASLRLDTWHRPDQQPALSLPADFDVEAYKAYSPEASALLGEEAEQHYLRAGRRAGEARLGLAVCPDLRGLPPGSAAHPPSDTVLPLRRQQGRLYKRPAIYLSWDAPFGLCNQLYDHTHIFALAACLHTSRRLEVTLAVPRAQCQAVVTRSPAGRAPGPRFGSYSWVPASDTLDLGGMRQHWGKRGVRFVQDPDASHCARGGLLQRLGVSPRLPVPAAAAAVEAYAVELLQPLLRKDPARPLCVHLHHPNPLWLIHQRRSLDWLTPALQGLRFAPALESLAGAIVNSLSALGHSSYLGVHLRIEKDWIRLGVSSPVERYIEVMRAANFTNTSACYLASGLFDHASDAELDALMRGFREAGVCGSVHHKESLLPPEAFQGLHSEQRALVNFLVLSAPGTAQLVGDARSTYSRFLREYRALRGHPKATFSAVTPGYNLSSDREVFVPDDFVGSPLPLGGSVEGQPAVGMPHGARGASAPSAADAVGVQVVAAAPGG